MESLSYAFEGRGLLFVDDIELQLDDGLVRSRNQLKRWDAEPLSLPIRDAVESMEFVEPGLPDVMRKSVLNAKSLQSMDYFSNDDSCKSVTSAITLNSLGSRYSNSTLRANDQNSAPIDSRNDKLAALKEPKSNQFAVQNSVLPSPEPPVSAKRARITNLQSQRNDKLAALKEPKSNQFAVQNSVLPSPEPPVSAKRARITNLPSQTPVCQVLDCNRDLSTSKDYHKRHKVCDLHSKTAVVIVNGIQQRFCQQCSRFHLLPEFDEGKRSCRKRLAGHNERRRKPQLDTHLGSMFFGTDLTRTPLVFPKILQGGFFGQQSNEPMNHSRHIKLEDESSQISQVAVPIKFGSPHSKSLFHLQSMGKQYPSKNCLNMPFSVQELSVDSNSSSALSLLSSQSQNLSGNSAGMSMAHPLILKENQHANLHLHQNCGNVFGKSMLKNFTPSVFKPFDGVDQDSFPVIPNASFSAGFDFPQNLISQESNVLNVKCYPSPEGANTVDLVQLSLHLQRVEHQKYSA